MEPIKIPSLTAGKFYVPEIIEQTLAATFGLDEIALPFNGGYSLEGIFKEFSDNENNYFVSKRDLNECQKVLQDSLYLHPDSDQLKDLLFDFSYGFLEGYTEFEHKMKPSTVFKETDRDVGVRIFRSVFALSNCDYGVIHPLSEATKYLDLHNPNTLQSKLTFGKFGIKAGEIYKALEIIVDHPSLFEPIFLREFNRDLGIRVVPNKEVSTFKLNQIALLFFYEGGGISRDNCESTAEEYGWCSKTSGEKLYQYFTKYSHKTERLGDPGSKKKLKNKIDLIESVVMHLSDAASQKAQAEITHLKNLFITQYE